MKKVTEKLLDAFPELDLWQGPMSISQSIYDLEQYFHINSNLFVSTIVESLNNNYSLHELRQRELNFYHFKSLILNLDSVCKYNPTAEKTASMLTDLCSKSLKIAIIKNDCSLSAFLIGLSGSIKINDTNAYALIKSGQNDLFRSITNSLKIAHWRSDSRVPVKLYNIAKELQCSFEDWVLTPDFKTRLDYICKNLPDIAIALKMEHFISASLNTFNFDNFNATLKYCSLGDWSILPSRLDIPLLESTPIVVNDVLKTIETISDFFGPSPEVDKKLAVIFNAFAESSKHDLVNSSLSTHGLLNNESFKSQLSDETKAVYLSIGISTTLEETMEQGFTYQPPATVNIPQDVIFSL